MPRSTTVWAAALVLASFTGSGPLLTTAEAMPAPGPQVTQGRPRYYFPRHVKRQIVTNSTAPAAPTLSSSTESSSTSSEQLQSRQLDFTSAINSFFNRPDSSSSLFSSSSDKDSTTGTVTSSQDIVVTPSPDRSNSPPGTGNLRPPPSPTPLPQEPEDDDEEPVRSPPPAQNSPSNGPIPDIVIPGTSAASSGSPQAAPEPTPSPSEPSGGLLAPVLSPVLDPVVGPTGLLPSLIVAPTPSSEVVPSSEPSPAAPSSFQGPFIVPGSTGGAVPSSVIQPTPSQGPIGGILSSLFDSPGPTPSQQPASTGADLPSSIVLPTPVPAAPSSEQPLLVIPSSGGIIIGITTALGTGAASPTPIDPLPSSGAIPTSEAVPSNPLGLAPILSSVVSEVNGIIPSGSAGPTAPVVTPTPEPVPSGVLPPLVSSLISDVSGILSSIVPEIPASDVPIIISSILSEIPTPTGPVVLPSATDVVSSIVPEISGVFPTASPSVVLPPASGSVIAPSETPSPVESTFVPSETPATPAPSGITPSPVVPSGTPSPSVSGIEPSGGQSGTGVTPIVTPTPTPDQPQSIPASEVPPSSAPSSVVPPSATNGTIAESPVVSSLPPSFTPEKPTTPPVTSQPPVQTQKPTGFDSATVMPIPSSIIREASTNPPVASPTSSGIPSSLPRMISPPNGVGTMSADNFLGQVCFKWPLNYPFVSKNNSGDQIFYYLPKAIANGLNISETDVQNMGLKPLDTTAQQGFITTLALFTIPKDLQSTLQAQLRNPADAFWHNKDQTVNELTGLINTACPLQAGGTYPGEGSPAQGANPGAAPSGGPGDGGAIGGDIGASRPINGSAAGIATGAIVGAIAYGAAMFFVARRYRNKRLAHQRASSVPSTGSRMTYGSIPGGAAAWMHGARNGRITPGSRGSRGSDSSQGRSVRTQQISAPVMAENSLGWN